jgi:hypothetical protein
MIVAAAIWVIEVFGFRICFGFRDSDSGFSGNVRRIMHWNGLI